MIRGSNEFQTMLYDLFTIFLSSIALLSYNLSQYRAKTKILSKFSQHLVNKQPANNKNQLCVRFAIAEIVLISLFQHGLVSPINKALGGMLGGGANYFGMIFAMPILLLIYCWLLGIHPFKQIDLITPAYPLALFFMKIGCFCIGCCRGISSMYGMVNYRCQKVELPVQLLEAAVALFLFVFLHFYKRKAKEGALLPTYIVLYCSIRFFSEFLRHEEAVLGSLKMYHILCLIGLCTGLVQLFILKKYRNKIEFLFAHNLPSIIHKKDKTE